MRTIYIIGMLLGSLFASAQTSIPEVLHQVAANNPELRANRQLIQSRKLEVRLDNNLADPSVSYSLSLHVEQLQVDLVRLEHIRVAPLQTGGKERGQRLSNDE